MIPMPHDLFDDEFMAMARHTFDTKAMDLIRGLGAELSTTDPAQTRAAVLELLDLASDAAERADLPANIIERAVNHIHERIAVWEEYQQKLEGSDKGH